MFLGVDFEFAKIVKGGRRAKLDSELLSLLATPGKDRLQAALPFIESFRYFFSLQDGLIPGKNDAEYSFFGQ